MEFLSLTDFFLLPVWLIFSYYMARVIRNRNIETRPEYKYFLPGMLLKVFGGIAFALIYALYYNGGDTINYFNDGLCYNKLLFSNPKAFYQVFKEGTTMYNYHYFSYETGLPMYWRDNVTSYVVRLSFLACLIGFRSYLVATLIFALVSFGGIWRVYSIFTREFPQLNKQFAIAILFLPSLIFWGSGILKDTVTLSCIGYFIHGFYTIFIRRRSFFSNIIGMIITSYLILQIKPYIFIALIPGILMWLINNYVSRIRGSFTKAAATPLFLFVSIISGYALLNFMSSSLGQYSLDKVLDKAVVTQSDLKADYYEGNSFDIGDLEPTIPSMLSHAHIAINAALFRPYLWESKNVVMILSGMENLFFLIFTLIVLAKLKVFGIFKYFVKHHLLTFSLIFSLFFAFAVGVSTPNFGSMVRYRIPILPFYISSLFIINHYIKEKRKEKEGVMLGIDQPIK